MGITGLKTPKIWDLGHIQSKMGSVSKALFWILILLWIIYLMFLVAHFGYGILSFKWLFYIFVIIFGITVVSYFPEIQWESLLRYVDYIYVYFVLFCFVVFCFIYPCTKLHTSHFRNTDSLLLYILFYQLLLLLWVYFLH